MATMTSPTQAQTTGILGRKTFEYGFYAAVVLLILTLTGVFASFEDREVLKDQMSLSTAFMLGEFLVAGLLTAWQMRHANVFATVLNGAIGSFMSGIMLSLMVLFTESVDATFVFRNLKPLFPGPVTFEQETITAGITLILIVSVIMGILAGLSLRLQPRLRNVIYLSLILTTIAGILQGQIDRVITLPDALLILIVFGMGYLSPLLAKVNGLLGRIMAGGAIGLGLGIFLGLLAPTIGLDRDTILRGSGSMPTILWYAAQGETILSIYFVFITTMIGMVGATLSRGNLIAHNGAWYFITLLLSLGMINWQGDMTLLAAILIFSLIAFVLWILPANGERAQIDFNKLKRGDQRATRQMFMLATFFVLIVTPSFAGQSITNTFNLMMLYIIMGLGLNVMIGFAGLLDLGYVASFAIGAYTAGLLTTPSLLTCGGQTADQIVSAGQSVAEVCTGVMTYWQAWPLAIIVAAFTGMALGVPVLRLRGDYLAIVTLGFGEITNRLLKSDTFKPLLGGPQGVSPIPVPIIDLSGIMPQIPLVATQVTPPDLPAIMKSVMVPDQHWIIHLSRATEIYYLYLFAVAVAALVVLSIINTRVGRAWRALREDEDVAEAQGIHLVWTKLLAFGISSAFAGLGGAIFGASLQGIFPDSFTILISINVLSLVIIGGMGSVPGVFLGGLMLVGLPEALRELQDYRLLVFGVLLVVAMLLKPEGLLPPSPPKLSERGTKSISENAESGVAAD